MAKRVPPNNPDAERAVLGAMLLSRDARLDVQHVLAGADFYEPVLGALYEQIVELEHEGRPADRLVLIERMAHAGFKIKDQDILGLQAASPMTMNVGEHAALVAKAAVSRRAAEVLDEASRSAWAGDPDGALAAIERARDQIAAPFDNVPPPTDALDLADEDHDVDWVVPGLLARHETVLIVAEPGSGKTTLLNQIATCCAGGIHPWSKLPMPKLRVLVFDFQDSRGARGRSVQDMLRYAGGRVEHGWLAYELRTQGIDLTQRGEQRWLEAKVARHKPDLIVLGPLYNAVSGAAGRSKQSEETAQMAASFLSEMIVRRDCALIVEAHAPHGEELRVRGSKLWEDWAAFGFGLRSSIVEGKRQFDLTRFRGDREVGRQWPGRFVQGHPGHWPWEAMAVPPDPTKGGQTQLRVVGNDDIPPPTDEDAG